MARVKGYLTIMYKYAGKEIDVMIEHFTNTAVCAVVIGDIIDSTVDIIHWNQNVILFPNRGATGIMYLEIWKRFLRARNEVFKTKLEKFMEAIVTVRKLIRENNVTLTFYSELEKSITKNILGEKLYVANEEKETNTTNKQSKKRKFQVPFIRKLKKQI